MPPLKKCPMCGRIYDYKVPYCELDHCPFCGNTTISEKEKNLRIFRFSCVGLFFLCVLLFVWGHYTGKFLNEYDMIVKIFIMVIGCGICATWLYRSIGVGKYSCETCGKKFSAPVTKIRLIELAKPNIKQRQIKETKHISHKCLECGAEMPVEAKYCGICGTKMSTK